MIVQNEYRQSDVAKFATLASGPTPATTLTAACSPRSTRFAAYRERGWGSELRAAFSAGGETWGAVMLLRSTDVAPFTDADAAFVASVGPAIGRALRSTVARAAAAAEDLNAGPGLVVLNRRGAEDFATQAARAWLGEETTAHPALASVAASVRGTGRPAAVRVRTDAGRWLTLSGSTLDADGRVAILVEPARAPEIAPLLVAAYGLTPRERDVLREVLHGRPTKEIARRLRLAPVTVQDHLKSIFEKTDSVSRSELVARLYFDHFEPRLGDPLAPTGGFVERSPTNLG